MHATCATSCSRAGAAKNQKKQEMLDCRKSRDLLFAEDNLLLDAQLDCASEERLRVNYT